MAKTSFIEYIKEKYNVEPIIENNYEIKNGEIIKKCSLTIGNKQFHGVGKTDSISFKNAVHIKKKTELQEEIKTLEEDMILFDAEDMLRDYHIFLLEKLRKFI